VTYASRVDRKYLLPESAVEALLEVDPSSWELDRVNGFSSQRYETLYFDTPELQFFHAARGKHRLRSKVRLRHYVETGDRFLEVKRRNARGQTTKVRAPWHGSLDAHAEFLGDSLGTLAPTVEALQPVALSTYDRVAYRLGDLGRMTIDKSLRFGSHAGTSHCLLDLRSLPCSQADSTALIILETKSVDQSPTTIDRILWDLGHRPRSLSKYALAIASVYPEIPLNRWARPAANLRTLHLP
jgi:VTC domain